MDLIGLESEKNVDNISNLGQQDGFVDYMDYHRDCTLDDEWIYNVSFIGGTNQFRCVEDNLQLRHGSERNTNQEEYQGGEPNLTHLPRLWDYYYIWRC